jgi:hypothetical protein
MKLRAQLTGHARHFLLWPHIGRDAPHDTDITGRLMKARIMGVTFILGH